MDQQQRIIQGTNHFRRAIDKIRRNVSFVELHPIDEFYGRFASLSFFDGNHTVLANLFQCISQFFADRHIVISTDRADVGNLFLAGHRFGHRYQFSLGNSHRPLNAFTNRGRITASHDVSSSLPEDRTSQYGRGRGTITGDVGRLAGDFIHQLGTHVLKAIIQFDFLRYRDTVFGYRRTAKRFVNNHVAASWPHGDRHCIR